MDRTDSATGAFALSVNRALVLYVALSLVAAGLLGYDSIIYLDRTWFVLVSVILAVSTIVMFFVTTRFEISAAAQLVFAAATFAAIASWPLAWTGALTHVTPFLWPILGGAVLALSWASREQWVVMVAAPLVALVWGFVRIDPAGGSAGVLEASQESIVVLAQVVGWALALGVGHRAAEELDASTDRAAAVAEQTAIRGSMQREQRTLDALVHDRVMTTLAAAGRQTMTPDRVAEMASGAWDALTLHDVGDPGEQLTAAETTALVTGMVSEASSGAAVDLTFDQGAVLPRRVGQAVARAVAEAVRNAVRHASAARIVVSGAVTGDDDAAQVDLAVSDDGIGYNPADVPERRLGVRLALRERMRSVGGTANVRSAPGHGTVVHIAWTGSAESDGRTRVPTAANPGTFAQLLDGDGLVWSGRLQVALMAVLGIVNAALVGSVFGWLTMGVLCVAGAVVFGPRVLTPMSTSEKVTVAALLACASLMQAATAAGWSASGTLFAAVVLIGLRARGTSLAAWFAVGLMAGVGGVAILASGAPLSDMLSLAALVLTVLLADYLLRWLAHVQAQVNQAHLEFEEAAARAASLFSALLRRDVWMAGVRSYVEPMLRRLTRVDVPLSQAERDQCIRLEARLRDSITARNLVSPAVSEAVEAARQRGVSVTLIDNREGPLPDRARQEALRQLAAAARAATHGRIVARVAPAEYHDLVTIMTDSGEGHTLISIDEEGRVTRT